MIETLGIVLKIQDLDLKMIRLVRLKEIRHSELSKLLKAKRDIKVQIESQIDDLMEIKQELKKVTKELAELMKKMEKIEEHQDSAKRVEEFNALAQEMTQLQRTKLQIDQKIADISERKQKQKDIISSLEESFAKLERESDDLAVQVCSSVKDINQEGKELKKQRDELALQAAPDLRSIYERLIRHKGDSVVVPIDNRACSGCHILVTAQHENLVRRGDRIAFCEHCSRIHYWQDSIEKSSSATTKRRRRRITS